MSLIWSGEASVAGAVVVGCDSASAFANEDVVESIGVSSKEDKHYVRERSIALGSCGAGLDALDGDLRVLEIKMGSAHGEYISKVFSSNAPIS